MILVYLKRILEITVRLIIKIFLEYEGSPFQTPDPQYDDPAVKYFRKSIQSSENKLPLKVPKLNLNLNCKMEINKGFLYPLCNSPKRKEYYRQVI